MAEEWIVFISSVIFFFGIQRTMLGFLGSALPVLFFALVLLVSKIITWVPFVDLGNYSLSILASRLIIWASFALVSLTMIFRNHGNLYGTVFFIFLSFFGFPGVFFVLQGFGNWLPFHITDILGSIFLFAFSGSFLWFFGVFSTQTESVDSYEPFLFCLGLPFALQAFVKNPGPDILISQGFLSLYAGLFCILGSFFYSWLSRVPLSLIELVFSYLGGIAVSAASLSAPEPLVFLLSSVGGILFVAMERFLKSRQWLEKNALALSAFGFLGVLGAFLPALVLPPELMPHSLATMLGVQFLAISTVFLSAILCGTLVYVFLPKPKQN